MIIFSLSLLIAYLLGSIPSGLWISRVMLGIDIREQGSGNIGMTNVMRSGGKWPGIWTFICDFFKGSIAVWLADYFASLGGNTLTAWQWVTVGVVAVLGHIFSCFLNFKGGKGVATTFGIWLAIQWQVGILAGVIWLTLFKITRVSSLSAISMICLLPLIYWLIPPIHYAEANALDILIVLSLSLLLLYKHAENIQRLLKGEEKPLTIKTK